MKKLNEQIQSNDSTEREETPVDERPSGLFECFHCLQRSVIWQCDYMFEDFGYEGNGIVQVLTCANCGAEIEYRIPLEDFDGDGEQE